MKHYILLCVLIGATGCKLRAGRDSKTSEAPDAANIPETLGIDGKVTWDQIKDATKGEVIHPWSDTYWPLMEKGLVNRWNTYQSLTKLSESPATLYEQYQEMKALETANKSPDLALLSPGEKYDLLVSSTTKVPLDVLKKLQDKQLDYDKNYRPKVKDIQAKIEAQSELRQKGWEKFEALRKNLTALVADYNKAKAEKNETLATDLHTKIQGMKKEAEGVGTEIDNIDKEMDALAMQRRSVTAPFNREQMELAKEMRAHLPMLGEAWQVWADYDQSDVEDLAWMGHCHGWAPAALVTQKPKHAVMVDHNGKKILFTEGDIRGLVTKIWSHQAPDNSVFFGARRCNASKIDYDEIGRVLDGTVCADNSDGKCDKNSGKVIYVKNNLIERGIVTYSEQRLSTDVKVAMLVDELGDENYRMKVFANMADFTAFKEKKGDKSTAAIMHLTVGCRDVNPMTLHLALIKLIKEKKTGFVLDVTRSSEVWNQPTYKYEASYLPVQLKAAAPDGSKVAKAGELADVDLVDDPFKEYRAEGTKYLAHLQTKIWYGMENGPFVDFDRDPAKSDDENSMITLAYTLEFDKDKKLIGGEWGPIPFPSNENNEASAATGDEPPDFIWYYPNGSKATAGEFREDIVDKLHKCSLDKPVGKTKVREVIWGDGTTKPTMKEVQVEYANCKI